MYEALGALGALGFEDSWPYAQTIQIHIKKHTETVLFVKQKRNRKQNNKKHIFWAGARPTVCRALGSSCSRGNTFMYIIHVLVLCY